MLGLVLVTDFAPYGRRDVVADRDREADRGR
jgi:hypothetical protein